MTSALQNRLVGTIILVALVVIFLPDFLDGKKDSNTQAFVEVPVNVEVQEPLAPPAFPKDKVINATSRPVELVDEKDVTDSTQKSVELAEPTSIAIEPPSELAESSQEDKSLQQQTVVTPATENDAGWVVQLGSFRHQKNVQELLDKLENAGYRAFSRKVDTSVGRLNKVFVGPELEKQKLDDALPHLKETTGLTGKVTSFDVVTN